MKKKENPKFLINYEPSAERIREMCQEIQNSWSPQEEQTRKPSPSYTIPGGRLYCDEPKTTCEIKDFG